MTEKTSWPTKKEVLEHGIVVDEERDNEVPDYGRAQGDETGPKAPAPGPDTKPPAR